MQTTTQAHQNTVRFLRAAALSFLLLAGCRTGTGQPPAFSPLAFSPDDRVLVLAPHPDDEVIACGGVIQQALAMKLPVRVVYFTYGDNNEWSFILYEKKVILAPEKIRAMGMVRHAEGMAACKALGLQPPDSAFLGYPDFGTLNIWMDHWNEMPAFQSMLTRVTSVPYTNALHYGAPYKGESIVADLQDVIRSFHPTKIFVSHPADQNPDHRALYLFTRSALLNLKGSPAPELHPYLVHFRSWPAPQGFHPLNPLPPPAPFASDIKWETSPLDEAQLTTKRAALEKHQSQYGYAKKYLESFLRENELFGDYPVVELRRGQAEKDISAMDGEDIPPDELSAEQRNLFTGIQRRTVRLEGDDLVITVEFSKPLASSLAAIIHVFGHRDDKPFSEMPKLRINVGTLTHTVFDQRNKLPPETVRVARSLRSISVHVPLSAAGQPSLIMSDVRINMGGAPLDWASWRILSIKPSASP